MSAHCWKLLGKNTPTFPLDEWGKHLNGYKVRNGLGVFNCVTFSDDIFLSKVAYSHIPHYFKILSFQIFYGRCKSLIHIRDEGTVP